MMLRKLVSALSSPVDLAYRGRAALAPRGLWNRYAERCRGAGLNKLYFVLSFDCDTVEDAEVAWSVHSRLLDMGVMPVYAVPGELLNRGEAVYRKILETGAEFINHGYREHTYFDSDRGAYASCFFYDQQPRETVREDIVQGDRNLRETLGVQARGFRAPHFGTFQRPAQLRFQHQVLRELGYAFSTSTVPTYAYRFGPVFRRFGLAEIPVSGMGARPLHILDTWTCFEAPNRRFQPQDYLQEGGLAAERFAAIGAGILNYYADPSHIHDRPEFFETVARWAQVAKPVTYVKLLEELQCNAA
ncbi:MAG: polysaccharide deacetylase family protein [Pseudomonadota bacterium]|nr:polysaccharide deacetylase family protein [Pseudomonadota bacterium]